MKSKTIRVCPMSSNFLDEEGYGFLYTQLNKIKNIDNVVIFVSPTNKKKQYDIDGWRGGVELTSFLTIRELLLKNLVYKYKGVPHFSFNKLYLKTENMPLTEDGKRKKVYQELIWSKGFSNFIYGNLI